MHDPLWMTGAVMCLSAVAGALLFINPPFAISPRAWLLSMLSGALVGLLLFSFFVADLHCEPGGKKMRCEYAGQSPKKQMTE
jgi:hypothetical protein